MSSGDGMTAEQWEVVWGVIRGCWPGSSLDHAVVKAEWRASFARCDAEVLVAAVRECARQDERPPNLARLGVWYTDLLKHKRKRLPGPRIPDSPPTDDQVERNYQANLVAMQRQLAHEGTCARCAEYAQSPGSPSKANPTRARTGAPCPIGATFWEPHWKKGMARPVG